MATSTTPLKPLDGAEGYLRWKESMLTRLHAIGVGRALYGAGPAATGDPALPEADRRRWARRDAVCRGYILEALSDRIFPDYAHHTTAGALWRALARTYERDTRGASLRELTAFVYDDGGAPLLEQLAHLEALGADAKLHDRALAKLICDRGKLPEEVIDGAFYSMGLEDVYDDVGMFRFGWPVTMSFLWDSARQRDFENGFRSDVMPVRWVN